MTIIFPAAGFARRNPDAPVKELMLHQGRSLIELNFDHLWQAQNLVTEILIITREAKLNSLEKWLQHYRSTSEFKVPVKFIRHEPNSFDSEWPQTVLASISHWSSHNLVLLPDTHLMLQDPLIQTFQKALSRNHSAWGISRKNPSEISSYGMVDPDQWTVTEKPQNPHSPWVWGCFGFQKQYGENLLLDLEWSTHNHGPIKLPNPSTFIELSSFEDLSRQST